jgi:processive 1,2-diacylglycerol beta-glucosyltransferase
MSADLPLVLVINGATNFEGDLKRVCELLAEFPVPLAALVLAVNDLGLRLRLRRMTRKSKNRVLITGYSNAVLDFMDSATCLICKAGGMTVSEALAKELPMLIYRTLPCQEEKNRDYLVEAGTALSAETIDELRTALNRLLLDPELRTNMQRQASLLKKPGAARDAAQLLSPYLTPGSQSAARRWR